MEDLSHDSVNRFLLRERYELKDLFDEVKVYINLVGGTLSVEDTVIDKPHIFSRVLIDFMINRRNITNKIVE
jgi:hypothetical protein